MRDYSENKGYLKVDIGGEERMIHFGMNALKILQDEFGLSLTQVGEKMEAEDIYDRYGAIADLFYAGLKAFDIQHNREIDYNRSTCLEWMLDISNEEVKRFMTAVSYMNGVDYILNKRGKEEPTEGRQSQKASTISKKPA